MKFVKQTDRNVGYHQIEPGDRVRLPLSDDGKDYMEFFIAEEASDRLKVRCHDGVLIVQPHSSNVAIVGMEPMYDFVTRTSTQGED